MRYGFLDAVRGIAALLVVLEHGYTSYWPSIGHYSSDYFDLGRTGITLFFLASGFIIPVSIERTRSLRHFWVSRFFRLYPLYWLSLVAILLLSVVKPGALNYHDRSVWNAAINFTMFQEFVGVPHAIQLYYTLTLEMAFYIACSVLFVLGWLKRSVALSAFSVGVVFVIGTIAPLIVGKRAPMLALFALMTMFFGTVLYRYTEGTVSLRTIGWLLVGIVVVSIPGTYMNYVKYEKSVFSWDRHTFVAEFAPWVVAYLLFFGAFALRHREFPRPLRWLGLISYSVYLMHPLLLIISAKWAPDAGLSFLVLGTLALATVTYYLVEKPCIELGRRVRSRM
jgi:peptidoglycan/LPS O-acetylase OafA/YrhL